jgi:pimeloyl-ACP methyl ester carboxylesterase
MAHGERPVEFVAYDEFGLFQENIGEFDLDIEIPAVERIDTPVDGPQSFASFDDLLRRTIEHNPTRSESSLRRGILHNARQSPDGSWQWRYDRGAHARTRDTDPAQSAGLSPLWDDFGRVGCPTMLVRGGISPVVDDDDVAEARRRRPDIEVVVVDGAGHSIQGDRPVELAAVLSSWLESALRQ